MASALQKQLAAIAASSTHQLDLKAQKSAHAKSLLFDAKTAASQSFDTLYLICYEGYRDLCALDSRFLPFAKSLFSEQSKVEDRTQMTKNENKKLDSVLEAFITLVGSKLLLKPAQKALEWLVRRFRVHEYNTESLTLMYLPYHGSPQFLALLSILPSQPPPSLRFLHPYIQSPTNPPRRTIVYTAINTPVFFDALQAYTVRVVQAGHQAPLMLSFWSGITVEAILGILDQSSTGRRDIQAQKTEGLVLRVLPTLNSCMHGEHGAEVVVACYAITVALVSKADLGDKLLDGLMEAVMLAQDTESPDTCLGCLALIAEQRSNARLPTKVEKKLLTHPQLIHKFTSLSKQCRVDRLALGSALGALSGMHRSDGQQTLFNEILASGLLPEPHTRTVLSALIVTIRDATSGSEEHGKMLETAAKLAETPFFLDTMRAAAKSYDVDLVSLGISNGQTLEADEAGTLDSDDDMLDGDQESREISPLGQLPSITFQSFWEPNTGAGFAEVAEAFADAVSAKRVNEFLALDAFGQDELLQKTLSLTFLARVWCSTRPVPVRTSALRAATMMINQVDAAHELQNMVPYLLYALTDPSPLVRRSAATGIAALSKKLNPESKCKVWGGSGLYGKTSSKLVELKPDEISSLLASVLAPILEESVMDSKFAVNAIRDLLEGSQNSTKNHSKQSLKAQVRSSILIFLAKHISLTPLLRVRLGLLPIFNFLGKVSDAARTSTILPMVQNWSNLPLSEATALCDSESLALQDAEQGHLVVLMPRDAKSVQFLQDVVSGSLSQQRLELVNTTYDRISALWSAMKFEPRLSLAQALLNMAFSESDKEFDKVSRERSLEILRSAKLDSITLVKFLENVPSAVQMPEGPPAKKRRRTSRNEMARIELSSQNNMQKLLRKLTIVLELIEGSDPGQHPALFRSLFNAFGELQPLRQQSGSELVYLQSMILGSLVPIVDTLKQQSDTTEYQSAVRADLLIDCIRHSTSPQVQNSALLLIANLASWVPELVLHNLMPIFTFIGSTLLRQQDDYSAQVVDKTISRVVPQLAASLRSKHKNFLSGVSDLLLSFTAAFEHIPLHRRLKLFSELARTLGPEDSLSAILALLADKYHNGKSQRRFSVELLLVFDPIYTLDAFKGYLDLVVDAASPKRKVSDTLFGLNEKCSAQVDSAIKDLLASLGDLFTDDRIRAHVGKAFRKKDDLAKPRAVFASIVVTTIQLSKKVTSSPKLYESCSRVLARCLDLLPTADLVKSAEVLLSNADSHVQIAAIKSVELRAGNAVQNDRQSVEALLSFLPNVEAVLQQSHEMDAKIISVSCIDRIIERFGKKDVVAVASVAQTISGAQALSHSNDKLRVLSLLCLTSIVDVLEDEAISLLPTLLPTAFEYLSQAITEEKTALHNAVYTVLSNIIERLGYVFSREYLETALRLCHRSAAADLHDTCDESRRFFYHSASGHLGGHEVFAAVKSTWPHAVSQGFGASLEHMDILRYTVNKQSKSSLIKSSSALFSLLLQLFKLRETISLEKEQEYDDEEMEQLDKTLVESTLAMVLKLNDATFRPFFAQLVDQEGPRSGEPSHAVTLYRFLAAFFDKFKSLVTSYSSYVIEHAAKMLAYLAKNDADEDLREAVLGALQKAFQHDQDSFWQAPSHYGTILGPLVKLLTIEDAEGTVAETAIATITELAAASSSSLDNHRELNTILLRCMRSDSAWTRLATVKCEQALTQRLGEEWLGLLPEMLPFISELREDDDEMVERETQGWIGMVEEVLGESLEGMLR